MKVGSHSGHIWDPSWDWRDPTLYFYLGSLWTAASATLVGYTALVDCMAVQDSSNDRRHSCVGMVNIPPVKAATACWGWISTVSGTK